MRATVYHGTRDMRVEQVPDPVAVAPTDAIVRVTHACICGSDLWPYRGESPTTGAGRTGHEFMGIVEEVGAEVATVRPGDLVVAPFAFSRRHVRVLPRRPAHLVPARRVLGRPATTAARARPCGCRWPTARWSRCPPRSTRRRRLLRRRCTLTDVMGTGHHAALCAGVRPATRGRGRRRRGRPVRGAGRRRLGAERVIALGRHDDRLAIARRFGATDIVAERGDEAVARVQGADRGAARARVLECVGTERRCSTAIGVARAGGDGGLRRRAARRPARSTCSLFT